MLELAQMTFEEIRDLDKSRGVALLPVGATEAHGPHLPLSTDVIIAEAMVRNAAERLEGRGIQAVGLPPVAYSVARYAAGFPGTVSIRPETACALLVDLSSALADHGFRWLGIANAHLEPSHIASIRDALAKIGEEGRIRVVFPDVTRKPWALRLTEEFKSGACHAGRYEGSIVMAARPELVRTEIARGLPANPISLSQAIREGRETFEEAGGPRAYFGDPAAATEEEGERTIEVLGEILAEALIQEMGDS